MSKVSPRCHVTGWLRPVRPAVPSPPRPTPSSDGQRGQAATASLILIFPLELSARVFAPTARRAAAVGRFGSAVGAG